MRVIDVIYWELCREQRKLNILPLTDPYALLRQSRVVDMLVVEYHKALGEADKRGRDYIPA